jgi:hypothetical protein
LAHETSANVNGHPPVHDGCRPRCNDFGPCEAGRLCIRSEDTAAAGNDFLQWAGCGAALGAVGLILIWQGSRQMRS